MVKLGNVYKLGESGQGSSTAAELGISTNTENSAVFSPASGWSKYISWSMLCLGVSGLRETKLSLAGKAATDSQFVYNTVSTKGEIAALQI